MAGAMKKKKPNAAEAMKAGVKKTYEETAKKVPPLGKESMKKKKAK